MRVPVTMRVGAENDGWRLITTQLNHERVMLGPAGRIAVLYDRVRAWAAERSLLTQPDVRSALARTSAAMRVNELLNWQVAAAPAVDVADASATKVFSSEQLQEIGQLLADVVGRHADPAEPDTAALMTWLDVQLKRNIVLTFGGGVNEIQRELIATAGLGLPRASRRAGDWEGRPPGPCPGGGSGRVVPRASPMSAEDAIRAAAARLAAAGDSRPRAARDPVNLPMIRNWTEAIGPAGLDTAHPGAGDPDTAPPAMIQVWTMPGLHGVRGDDDPLGQMSRVLDEAGYTSVVATNCDQIYHRYLKLGEQLSVQARLLDVAGPKRTALGEGWFVTTRSTWFSAGEPVATMDFRILKFRPPASPAPVAPPAPAPVMRPLVTPDTAFFWAGTAVGELRIQRCQGCGALRHPPGPFCPACGDGSSRGTSSRPVPARSSATWSIITRRCRASACPIVVALVQLPEGVRMVGEMPGVSPDRVRIGLPVHVMFVRVDDELTSPRLAAGLRVRRARRV